MYKQNKHKMKLQVMYRVHRQIALSNQEEETLADWSPYIALINDILYIDCIYKYKKKKKKKKKRTMKKITK